MSALLQGTNQGKFLKKILHTSQYVLKKSFTFAGPLAVAHFEGGKSSSSVRIITSHIMVSHHHESTLFFQVLSIIWALSFFIQHWACLQHTNIISFLVYGSKSFQFAFG